MTEYKTEEPASRKYTAYIPEREESRLLGRGRPILYQDSEGRKNCAVVVFRDEIEEVYTASEVRMMVRIAVAASQGKSIVDLVLDPA